MGRSARLKRGERHHEAGDAGCEQRRPDAGEIRPAHPMFRLRAAAPADHGDERHRRRQEDCSGEECGRAHRTALEQDIAALGDVRQVHQCRRDQQEPKAIAQPAERDLVAKPAEQRGSSHQGHDDRDFPARSVQQPRHSVKRVRQAAGLEARHHQGDEIGVAAQPLRIVGVGRFPPRQRGDDQLDELKDEQGREERSDA